MAGPNAGMIWCREITHPVQKIVTVNGSGSINVMKKLVMPAITQVFLHTGNTTQILMYMIQHVITMTSDSEENISAPNYTIVEMA